MQLKGQVLLQKMLSKRNVSQKEREKSERVIFFCLLLCLKPHTPLLCIIAVFGQLAFFFHVDKKLQVFSHASLSPFMLCHLKRHNRLLQCSLIKVFRQTWAQICSSVGFYVVCSIALHPSRDNGIPPSQEESKLITKLVSCLDTVITLSTHFIDWFSSLYPSVAHDICVSQ